MKRIAPAFAMLLTLATVAACSKGADTGPPPRASDAIDIPAQESVIAVPVEVDLAGLAASLESEVPRTLHTIDRPDETCVASKRVKVAFVKLKTPDIKCDLQGKVTRGKLRLKGQGRDILVTFPVRAEVHARDIGGILSEETATAEAIASARMRIHFDDNWNPVGSVDLNYSWNDEPHIDFLGQRIEFTKDADKQLRKVIARLERKLPAELDKLKVRQRIDDLWGKAFTALQLNRANPPVWMRITPKNLQYGGYSLSGDQLSLKVGMKALTETFVGDRPADPQRTPLPPKSDLTQDAGSMVFFIPVIADYKELEPVVQKALRKRQARPFAIPGIGPVMARFGDVEIYGTTGGRIAAGVTFTATPQDLDHEGATGKVWLIARPVNQPGSREVSFADVTVRGDTDNRGADLLLKLAGTPGFSRTVGIALAQNFEGDYSKLMQKVSRAISDKREGDLIIRAQIDRAKTGSLRAAGQGLYLPVWGEGTASIALPAP